MTGVRRPIGIEGEELRTRDIERRLFDLEAKTTARYLGRANHQGAGWTNGAADGYEEWGGGFAGSKGIIVTKRRSDTILVIRADYGVFGPTAALSWNVKVNEQGASDVDGVAAHFKNTANDHAGMYTVVAQSTALAAGLHTFKLMIDSTSNTVQTDANDAIAWEVWEVPIP